MYNYFPENMQSTYISLSRRSSAHLLQDKKKKRSAEQQQHRKKEEKTAPGDRTAQYNSVARVGG
jgi:hypothetical protein